MSTWTSGRRPKLMRLATWGLIAATLAACGGGGDDDDGGGIIPPPNPPMNVTPPPAPLTPALPEGSSLPGVEVTINGVTGGTGAGGTFQPGDSPAVNFTIRRDDGSPHCNRRRNKNREAHRFPDDDGGRRTANNGANGEVDESIWEGERRRRGAVGPPGVAVEHNDVHGAPFEVRTSRRAMVFRTARTSVIGGARR